MRRLLVPLASLALAAGLTACGNDPVAAIDVVRTAAAATVKAETAHVDVTLDGEIDASASFTGRLDGSAVDGTVKAAGFEVPVRLVDGVAYVRMPFGDRWLGMDLSKLREAQPDQAGVADALQGTGVLQALGDVADVQAAGQEDLDGVSTSKYTAVIDLQTAAADLPPKLADALQGKAEGTVPVTVWIDGDDLVRRVVVEDDAVGRLQVDVTDVGVVVDVQAPPADQVRMVG